MGVTFLKYLCMILNTSLDYFWWYSLSKCLSGNTLRLYLLPCIWISFCSLPWPFRFCIYCSTHLNVQHSAYFICHIRWSQLDGMMDRVVIAINKVLKFVNTLVSLVLGEIFEDLLFDNLDGSSCIVHLSLWGTKWITFSFKYPLNHLFTNLKPLPVQIFS